MTDKSSLKDRYLGLVFVAAGFCDAVEDAVAAHASKGKGGQQVPFHGDFCPGSVSPSALGRLRWWAQLFRRTLNGDSPVSCGHSASALECTLCKSEVKK